MARKTSSNITRRSDLTRPMNQAEVDENFDSLKQTLDDLRILLGDSAPTESLESMIDLSGYATTTYVDNQIASIDTNSVDLSGYATTTYVDNQLSSIDTDTLTTDDIAEASNLYYTDDRVDAHLLANSYTTEAYVDLANAEIISTATAYTDTRESAIRADIPTNTNQLINDAGFITAEDVSGPIEVNPTGDLKGSIFGADNTLLVDSPNSVIPKANVEDSANWDIAYSWGDHSQAGYLTDAYTRNEVDILIEGIQETSNNQNLPLQLVMSTGIFLEKNTTTDTPTTIASSGTISYGSDARNTMDYYLPASKTKGVVLYIHGGGWSSGEKDYPEFLEYYKPEILSNGYALLSMNYRLAQDPVDYTNPISGPFNQNADDHAWPAQLNDVKKVLALLMSDDESVSSDQTEWTTLRNLVKDTAFMVTGESAGGHLTIMGVFEYALDTDGVWPDAVFNNVGPMDIRSSGPDDPNNPFGQAGLNLRATLTENDPDKINSASAAFRLATWKGISNYYTNNTKFYFYANNNDTIVPHTSITPFVEELTQDLGENQVTYLRETVGTPTAANPGNGYLLGDPNPTQYVADHNITFEKNAELAKSFSLSGLSKVLIPDAITLTPEKSSEISESQVSFVVDPSLSLINSGQSKILKAIDFEGNEYATVSISAESEGITYTDSKTIALLSQKSSSEGQRGDTGPRGPGRFSKEISGTSWSNNEATSAITNANAGSPVSGDVVTLINTNIGYIEDRSFDGNNWIEIQLLIDGNTLVDGSVTADKLILSGGNAPILRNENGVLVVDNANLNSAISVDQVITQEVVVNALEGGQQIINANAIKTGSTITSQEDPNNPGEFLLVLGDITLNSIKAPGRIDFTDGEFTFENDFPIGEYYSNSLFKYDGTAKKAALLVAKTEPTANGEAGFALGVGATKQDYAAVLANNDNSPGVNDNWPTNSTRNTNVGLARNDIGANISLEANSNGSHPAVAARLATYESNAAYAAVFDGDVVFNGNVIGASFSNSNGGIAYSDLRVNTNSPGASALSYNSSNGTFTYTPPNLSSYLTSVDFSDLTDTPSSVPSDLAFVAAEFGSIVYKDFNEFAGIPATPGTLAQRDTSGNLVANNFITSSDQALKQNIEDIDSDVALQALQSVQPKTFQYNESDDQQIGFIAQDMEQFYPELVSLVSSNDDDGFKCLNYPAITAVLWKQNQELLRRIELLEQKLVEK